MGQKVYLWLFIIGVLVVAYFIAKPGYEQLSEGWESRDWPETGGLVTLSKISHQTDVDEEDVFTFNIEYAYQVDGKKYRNSKYSPRPIQDNDADDLAEYLQKHPEGSTIVVFYNPADPAQSLIEPGMKFGSWMVLIIGSLIGLFGLWVLYHALKG